MKNPDAPHACRICGTTNHAIVYTAREMMYGFRDEFHYFQCSHCDCLQITEIPDNISKYYPGQYYSFSPYSGKKFKGIRGKVKTYTYYASLMRATLLQKLVSALVPIDNFKALKGIPLSQATRVLEVGCGNGDKYLYPMAEMKFKNLLGCDPFISESMHYSNGLHINKTDIFKIEGIWDIIIYHYSFEHVSNPLENLQQVKRLLANHGTCIISVPTVSSYAWKHFKTNWYQLDAPRHFFIYSQKSMEFLAKKAGLKVSRTTYDSDYKQFVISEKYAKDIPMIAPDEKGVLAYLKRKLTKVKYTLAARKLNREGLGDIAYFYLEQAAAESGSGN